MQYTTIEQIHTSPWGIVSHRRDEIERGPFGTFEKVLGEEIDWQFPTASLAAQIMECSETTARNWLRESDARFIFHDGVTRFCRDDVMQIAATRNAKIKERAEKKAAKARVTA